MGKIFEKRGHSSSAKEKKERALNSWGRNSTIIRLLGKGNLTVSDSLGGKRGKIRQEKEGGVGRLNDAGKGASRITTWTRKKESSGNGNIQGRNPKRWWENEVLYSAGWEDASFMNQGGKH